MVLKGSAIAAVGVMLICAVMDMFQKSIWISCIMVFMILNGSMGFLSQHDWKFILSGAAVGGFLTAVSLLTGEALGKGDAFLVLGSGLYLGFAENLIMVFDALFLVSMYGVALMLTRKKKNWKREIPFAPFLAVPYIWIVASHFL